jgi:hypothetical protein
LPEEGFFSVMNALLSSFQKRRNRPVSKSTAAAVAGLFLMSLALSYAPVLAHARELMNGTRLPFYIYQGFRSPQNHYAPSGWMGDYGDLAFADNHKLDKKSKGVIRVSYNAKGAQGAGWAGIYWQHPANNWGNREGGFNLNGAKQLVFLARGHKGGETISEFKVGGIEGTFRDSGAAAIGPLTLTSDWKEYAIKLEGQELSSIAGGFAVVMTRDYNPNGATLYLDNIRFE